MKKTLRILILGFLLWIICFIIAVIVWPLHDKQFMLFKSIMVVTGTVVNMALLAYYFNKISDSYFREGIAVGVIWFIENIVLDLIVLVGLLKTPPVDYLISPGLLYLNMPVLSIGIGYILSKRK